MRAIVAGTLFKRAFGEHAELFLDDHRLPFLVVARQAGEKIAPMVDAVIEIDGQPIARGPMEVDYRTIGVAFQAPTLRRALVVGGRDVTDLLRPGARIRMHIWHAPKDPLPIEIAPVSLILRSISLDH